VLLVLMVLRVLVVLVVLVVLERFHNVVAQTFRSA
jgi:hypothetical protein